MGDPSLFFAPPAQQALSLGRGCHGVYAVTGVGKRPHISLASLDSFSPGRSLIQNCAASTERSCNCSLSAIRAINSELVGLPLVLDTV